MRGFQWALVNGKDQESYKSLRILPKREKRIYVVRCIYTKPEKTLTTTALTNIYYILRHLVKI